MVAVNCYSNKWTNAVENTQQFAWLPLMIVAYWFYIEYMFDVKLMGDSE